MKWSIALLAAMIFAASAQEVEKKTTASGAEPSASLTLPTALTLMDVKRIYVAPLTGGVAADQLRDLIIASLGATKDFVITENENRADAVLKGAGEDKAFNDVFNYSSGTSYRENDSGSGGGYNRYSRNPTVNLAGSGSEHESERDRVQKHEARAAVRLCNKEGDVIWSTTQESDGGKFHGASAEVALRVAKQLSLDLDRERKRALGVTAPAGGDSSDLPPGAKPTPVGPR
jgi:hypothetical protein